MNLSPDEVLYITSFRELGWGILLVAATMVMHGFGMILTLQVNNLCKPQLDRASAHSFVHGVSVLILVSWIIIVLHLFEVLVWSGFFVWKGAMPNFSISFYFSLMDYTTLGSSYNLPRNWRLLEGMIAIAGLMTFAWSTGVLLTVAQEFQDREMRALRKRYQPAPPVSTSI